MIINNKFLFLRVNIPKMQDKKININSLLKASLDSDEPKIDLHQLFEARTTQLGITMTQASELLSIERKSLLSLLTGESKQPNMLNVLKVAEFLEISLNNVLKSILSKQSPENIASLQSANKMTFLAKNFDIDKLYKEKFITAKNDTDSIINRVISYYGFREMQEYEDYEKNLSAILFSQPKRNFTDRMRDFAIKSAYRLFELIDNPNTYNREILKDLIPKIKPYSRDVENGLYIVCKALYNHGITVIFQKHLTTSQYRGATFIVNNKPCIVLTDLNKSYPTVWFALLHELYHVLFDYDIIATWGYHLTGEPSLVLINEEQADDFAQNFFFGIDMFNYIKPHINNQIMVDRYAKQNSIDPSFVYRGFQFFSKLYDKKDYWKAFHQFMPELSTATKKLNPMSWKDDVTLPNIAIQLKQIFEIN